MDILTEYAQVIAPAIAGALTVPILQGIKRVVVPIDNAPAWAKRIIAVSIAFALAKVGAAVNVILPGELQLIDGGHLEALAAGGVALAIHAGDKNRTPRAGTTPVLVFGLLLLMPVAAACQTGRATVRVIDRSNLTVVVTPSSYTGEVGDTLTFSAVAIDTISGDTIPSVFRWTSTDSTGVQVDPNTGEAVLLRAGTYDIEAMVTQIVAMLITSQQDDGSWAEVFSSSPERQAVYAARGFAPDTLRMEVGETRPVCAYLVSVDEEYFLPDSVTWSSSDESIVSVGPSSSQLTCPTWSPGLGWVSRALRIPVPRFMRTVQLG